ncbi:hypothetical protein JHK82_028048 [Glycine max]|nr:hypothetical protein JHK82_028048 [Glycine max]
MESAYRAWLREKRDRSTPEELNELCRELQTPLGTTKWQDFKEYAPYCVLNMLKQLEEFDKAVKLSYQHHGKLPLWWVNLDEEERDDLAAFLSGACQTTQSTNDECMEVTQAKKEDKIVDINTFCNRDISVSEKSSKDVISVSKDTDYVIEIKADAASRSNDDVVSQTDRITSTRKTWTTPNYGVLKIAIADEGEQRDKPTWTVDATPKEKGFRNLFWKQKFEEYPQAMRAVCMFNQRFEHIGICQSQRQFQSPLHLRYGCSVQVTLALMLTIFLIERNRMRTEVITIQIESMPISKARSI